MNEPLLSPELAARLPQACHLAVLTGAGTSAESGVPTFRDAQTGLWARFRAEELATPEAFNAHPRRVWEWYAWRRQRVAAAEPNAGHRALVELAGRVPTFTLITQNVDGLHQRAGSTGVIELHGNLTRSRCSAGCGVAESVAEDDQAPPPCPRCGAPLRPDVVWFGESLPAGALEAAWRAAEECDVFLSLGTSALVQPAASLPQVAASHGAVLIEVNPEATPLSRRADAALRGGFVELLPRLVREVWG